MTSLYLIRHGSHDWLNKGIAGWQNGIHLNEEGRIETERLIPVLQRCSLDLLYSSPLDRTIETAVILSEGLGIEHVHVNKNLGEVDFGEWNGLTFGELDQKLNWQEFNTFRSVFPVPGGESSLDLQHRIVTELLHLSRLHAGKNIGIVSHGDVIRSAVLYFLGMPIDFIYRIEISPASVTLVQLDKAFVRVLYVNYVPELP